MLDADDAEVAGLGFGSPPHGKAPTPESLRDDSIHPRRHRAGSAEYMGMSGEEDMDTLWQSTNVFFRCVSIRLDGACGLPSATEIFCEVQAGSRVRLMPLLLSQADLNAGGGGRVDGGRLSERLDILLEDTPEELEVRLVIKSHGPMWTQRSEKLAGQCLLVGRWSDATVPAAVPSEWLPMTHPEASMKERDEEDDDGSEEPELSSTATPEKKTTTTTRKGGQPPKNGPALLARVQCFERADLEDAETRAKLFAQYSENGSTLTAAEFDTLLLDVSSGRHVASGELDLAAVGAAASSGRPRGWIRTCVGHLFAAFGLYKPRVPLFSYLMYYHTLLWVVCRAPGEEHIPIVHRLSFVLLSLAFNLLVVVLFTATDCSLLSINCPETVSGQHDGGGEDGACSDFARSTWMTAQVLLVAIIDTAFFPLLRALFYFIEDLWSARRLSDTAWKFMRILLLVLIGVGLSWVGISAAKHASQLGGVLDEFLSTWPAARLTETFKLMSLWGILVEYGQSEPPHVKSSGRASSPAKRAIAPALASDEADSKRVPLLSDQR